MNVILFGATGMVGQGVLLECLEDARVERVLALVRRPTGRRHDKLQELVHADFADYSGVEASLRGFDACFFCLGVSAAGLSEAQYRHITVDFTLAAARTIARLNPGATFSYVSGDGTDSTQTSRMMWARVKGQTENELLTMPFRAVYLFRPGYIQPVKGVVSVTRLYRAAYSTLGVLYPLWKALFPRMLTTSEALGRAMIEAAMDGGPSRVIGVEEINRLAAVPRP